MAVFKSPVEVRDPSERSIGVGMAYIHLPRGAGARQDATGTVSLRRWEPRLEPPSHLALEDGRRLSISVSSDVISECSRNHILRFHTVWPGAQASPHPSEG